MRYAFSKTDRERSLKIYIAASLEHNGVSKASSKLGVMSDKIVLIYKELEEINDYISAEDFRILFISKQLPNISIGTFYKYLQWLADIGMVHRQKHHHKPDLFRAIGTIIT
ncbi:hypothetical protein D0C36_08750 [Mucilaginibacter conchicola]|uniref:Uncharacterized protein n=1 Tax=Mucilaginibacter conchicola TaxID=2303333 RepID=A0A372P0Z8_9SPHI|nr:transcriptional repressor [Mucilaginibacter conchicola]RFZ95589.1 hypothetical protein D0C36_08750 [Mucilaginibacter conchicola]